MRFKFKIYKYGRENGEKIRISGKSTKKKKTMETRPFSSLNVRGWSLTVPEAGNHVILHDSLPASKGGRHVVFDGETKREIIRRGPVLNIGKLDV